MSRTFTDDDLMTWEVYASGGKYGLALRPKIVFHCLTDPRIRPRFVAQGGHEADAEEHVSEVPLDELKRMLAASEPLE